VNPVARNRRLPWTPDVGDVVSVCMAGPGRERRPALVLSPAAFSARAGVVIVCPVVTEAMGCPFEVPVPSRSCADGVVLADRVTSLHLRRTSVTLVGTLPARVVADVLERLLPLLVPSEDAGHLAALSRTYTHASGRTAGSAVG
jgi:mRNA interferase MazF